MNPPYNTLTLGKLFTNRNSKSTQESMTHQDLIFSKFNLLIVLIISLFCYFETSNSQNLLQRGSSLSVEDSSHVLTSPDKTFTCGFSSLGENAYWFSIWFTDSKDKTVVWVANHERPVNGKGSKLSLQRNGEMVLRDADGTFVWTSATPSTGVDRAELLDSGNLVLKDIDGKILWQSFDFPTDTLVPNQPFTKSTKLICRLGMGTYASGYFNLYFDTENILSLMYDGPDTSSVYWPNPDQTLSENGRKKFNSSRIAVLDEKGNFFSSDEWQFSAFDMGFGIKRRLKVDYDGNLRVYSLNNVTGSWMITWQALMEQCRVQGICGRNGICVYIPEPKCSCPPGYEVARPGNWIKGCKPKFKRTCSTSQQLKFIEVPQADFYGFDINFLDNLSMESCRKLCVDDCRCEAFSYRLTGLGRCFTKSALFNGYISPTLPTTIYIKVPADFEVTKSTSPSDTKNRCRSEEPKAIDPHEVRWIYFYSFASAVGALEALFFVLGWWFLLRSRHGVPSVVEDGYSALSSHFRKFSYSELKKATQNFKNELGRGASGAVYKGVISDERVVAVKRLGDMYQGEEVFWAEVSLIGKIYHMNLVRMWGFCSEGINRLLVYEYIENKSLDKHLFSSDYFLGWKERFKVALGIAKGLAYLHHECLEWVIHCDVKPENILLDGEFEPKIADFGLAKLSQRGKKGPEFSRIRGTKGYMAPEWAMNLPITAKADVYSYGVMILEMVKGIRLSYPVVEDGEEEQEAELTRNVRIVKRKIQCGEENWIDDMVDPRLNGMFSRNQAEKLVEIGISCVEEDRNRRPTMDSIVLALSEWEAESEVHHQDN